MTKAITKITTPLFLLYLRAWVGRFKITLTFYLIIFNFFFKLFYWVHTTTLKYIAEWRGSQKI
jgi:hypothetical protein